MSLTPTIQTVKGRPGPIRALEFNCVGRWNGADEEQPQEHSLSRGTWARARPADKFTMS